jgi:aminocarboxymuconate-semialdehyde decarboxylase
VIDLHAHVMLEACLGAAGDLGPWVETTDDGRPRFRVGTFTLDGVAYRDSPFMDVSLRLAGMALMGIDHQVLSPNPLLWFHHLPAPAAVAYCRVHNDAMAALVAQHPDRLSGLAHLPVQDPTAAARELERSVGLGLRGGAFGTDFGMAVDDPRLDPVWARAQDLGVPLFLHPGSPGIDGPDDERVRRHGFDLHGGFAAEETLTVWNLVFGRVLERFPRLDVVISHGGGATAMLLGRWRRAMATRPGGTGNAADVDRWIRRLWFDAHVGSDAATAALVAEVGTDRLVFGTNFAGWDDDGVDLHGLDPTTLDTNARRLLPGLPKRVADTN